MTVVAAGYYGMGFALVGWLISFSVVLYLLIYVINKSHVYIDMKEIADEFQGK